ESSALEPIEVYGARDFLVEYMRLAPSTVASVSIGERTVVKSFPFGSEFPEGLVPVFSRAYNEWVEKTLASGAVLRRYVGPVNRCDLCYQEPPARDRLK